MRSAKRPYRPEAEFFADPQDTAQRRYEALRAYFMEGATAAQAAARFGYAESSVQAMVRDFRAGDRGFFIDRRPGPRVAPAKQAARDQVLRLRQAGHSITEIEQELATTATPLNRTGIWELLRDEGFERLPTRHPRGLRPLQRAEPAGAQSHRPPPHLPRRRRRHRPRPGHLRRPGIPAQGDRTGHLLLPAGPPPPASAAGRARPRDGAHRPGPRHRVRPGLPRDHALRPRCGPGDPLRAPPLPANRECADLLRPGRPDPQPRLRQRHLHQDQPGRRGHGVRAALGAGHRQAPGAAGVRLQGHHRRRPVRPGPGRHRLPHPTRPQPQAPRHPGRAARHHLDALSSAVALNVDLDTTLTVWAQAAYDALRRRLPGYATATPDTIWRRFVSTSGQVTLGPTEVVARIAERTSSPVLRSADLPEVEVPWWGGRRLRFEIAVGKTK